MKAVTTPHIYQLPERVAPLPCQACGCGTVFAAVAPPGQRLNPFFLRCCQCGQERHDLAALDSAAPSA
jgi:hypothetical protein